MVVFLEIFPNTCRGKERERKKKIVFHCMTANNVKEIEFGLLVSGVHAENTGFF